MFGVSDEAKEFLEKNYNILKDPVLEKGGLMPYIQKGFQGEIVAIPEIKYIPGEGPVTKEANRFFDKDRHCVEIIVVYISILADPNLSQSLVAKNPPLKLTFVVIDEEGEDDPAATYELYHAMLDAKDPLPASK